MVSYTTVSPLPCGPKPTLAVCSLRHFPSGHPAWKLSSTLPFGVRTFLDDKWDQSPRSSDGLAWHMITMTESAASSGTSQSPAPEPSAETGNGRRQQCQPEDGQSPGIASSKSGDGHDHKGEKQPRDHSVKAVGVDGSSPANPSACEEPENDADHQTHVGARFEPNDRQDAAQAQCDDGGDESAGGHAQQKRANVQGGKHAADDGINPEDPKTLEIA